MTPPFDEIAFLTRSPNRVAVLGALAEGRYSRRELVDETPASRVTVGRILHDFGERGWVRNSGEGYEATTRGRLLAQELLSVLDRLRAIDRLDPVLPWFPIDRLDVPLSAFGDADVTVPTTAEPNRHHRRIGTVGGIADHARMYSQGATKEAIDIHRSAIRNRGQRLELVLTRPALDAIAADDQLRAEFRTLAAAAAFVGTVERELSLPFVALFDGRCFLGAVTDSGAPAGVVESDDDALVAWTQRTLDEIRAAAVPLDLDAFTA
ncbi:hypothetical protein [Salinigranum marinum]|uniref:helix-turn-helix transcriptional regulator n=1 Tax=Salinigranum marinum TaxID=1515595 RepID=UPI002989E857|nr:hypothetical protein [Salinigranum marinum]